MLLGIIIFLFPTQLGLHFWPQFTHIFGVRIDYFAPTVYLTDILVGLFVTNFLIKQKGEFLKFVFRYKLFVFGLLIFSLFNILFSQNIFVSFFKWLRVYEMILFGWVIARTKMDFPRQIVLPLSLSLIFFSLLGILQFIKGESLGGIFYFLGERTFSGSTPGIALVELLGINHLRSYSTFSHPNSFAGFVFTGLLLVLTFWKKGEWGSLKSFVIIFSLATILVSFSQGVYLASFFILLIILLNKLHPSFTRVVIYSTIVSGILISLLAPLLSANLATLIKYKEIYERLWLNFAAGEIYSRFPLTGVGLNNFLVHLPSTSIPKNVIWNLQPVHNIFLLILSELGLIGIVLVLYFLTLSLRNLLKTKNNKLLITILAIFITGLFDHYWLTLQQNLLLLSLVLGLSLKNEV
jgi:O-antigen ligase